MLPLCDMFSVWIPHFFENTQNSDRFLFCVAHCFCENWCTLPSELLHLQMSDLTWYGCCETRFSFLSPFNLDSCASLQKIGLLASNLLSYTGKFMMYTHNFMWDTKILCIICYWIDVVRLNMAQKSCIGNFFVRKMKVPGKSEVGHNHQNPIDSKKESTNRNTLTKLRTKALVDRMLL